MRKTKSVAVTKRDIGQESQSEQYQLAESYTRIPKLVMEDLKERYFNQPSYVPGDPYAMAFREGQRDVVLYIRGQLKKAGNPELFENENFAEDETRPETEAETQARLKVMGLA